MEMGWETGEWYHFNDADWMIENRNFRQTSIQNIWQNAFESRCLLWKSSFESMIKFQNDTNFEKLVSSKDSNNSNKLKCRLEKMSYTHTSILMNIGTTTLSFTWYHAFANFLMDEICIRNFTKRFNRIKSSLYSAYMFLSWGCCRYFDVCILVDFCFLFFK